MNEILKSTEIFDLSVDETINRQEFSLSPDDYIAVYARKSLVNDNNSILGQLQRAKEIIKQKNLLLYNEYIDNGVSATKTEIHERKGLNQLLEDAKKQKFKTVIVYKSDRLARNPQQAIKIRNIFKANHINVIYSSQGDFSVPNDYMGDFIQNILIGLDELEAITIAKRIAAGKHSKRLRGEYSSSTPPFGYIRFTGVEDDIDIKYLKCSDPKDFIGYYIPNQKASLIENLFLKCLYLNPLRDDGITQDEFIQYAKDLFKIDDKNISPSVIDSYINNTVYGGFLKVNSKKEDNNQVFFEDIKGSYVVNYNLIKECSNIIPIVDQNTYIQAFLNWNKAYQRKERKQHTYLFNNLLHCTCGKKIDCSNIRYKCSTNQCTSIQKDYLEKILLNKIVKDLTDKPYLENHIKERIIQKTQDIYSDTCKVKTKLKNNKKIQRSKLKDLVENPHNKTTHLHLNKLLHKEAEYRQTLDFKEKQLHSIRSIFFNQDEQSIRTLNSKDIKLNHEQLDKISLYLSNSIDELLHKENIESTLNYINLVVEKVVIYARRKSVTITDISFGN